LDRLLKPWLRLLLRNAKAPELVVPVALADAKIESAVGDQVEGGRLLGQQYRIVPGQHDDGGAEPQRSRPHRETSEQGQRGRDLIPAGEMVLDGEARMKAERPRLDVEVEIIAKSLAGLGPQLVAVGLRGAEQTETHAATSPPGRGRSQRCRCARPRPGRAEPSARRSFRSSRSRR